MHLQNEVLTGKTFIINDSNLPNEFPSLKQQPEVNRTRKILLNLIGVLLMICFMNFIFTLYTYGRDHSLEGQSSKTISQLVSLLLSIVYYGFGLLITYRYYRTGLLVFAWLGLLSLLAVAVLIVIALIVVTKTTNIGVAETILAVMVTIIICLIASLLQIFTVRYAFVLSKLLKNTKPLTNEQI